MIISSNEDTSLSIFLSLLVLFVKSIYLQFFSQCNSIVYLSILHIFNNI